MPAGAAISATGSPRRSFRCRLSTPGNRSAWPVCATRATGTPNRWRGRDSAVGCNGKPASAWRCRRSTRPSSIRARRPSPTSPAPMPGAAARRYRSAVEICRRRRGADHRPGRRAQRLLANLGRCLALLARPGSKKRFLTVDDPIFSGKTDGSDPLLHWIHRPAVAQRYGQGGAPAANHRIRPRRHRVHSTGYQRRPARRTQRLHPRLRPGDQPVDDQRRAPMELAALPATPNNRRPQPITSLHGARFRSKSPDAPATSVQTFIANRGRSSFPQRQESTARRTIVRQVRTASQSLLGKKGGQELRDSQKRGPVPLFKRSKKGVRYLYQTIKKGSGTFNLMIIRITA